MKCLNPIKLINPRYRYMTECNGHRHRLINPCEEIPLDYYLEVPCGKCFNCRTNYMREWRSRLYFESVAFDKNIFVTLTFDNENLTSVYNSELDYICKDSLSKKIRLFCDRWRKKYGSYPRHWFITEFGETNNRLHLHGIIFNCDISNEDLAVLWQYGLTYVGYTNLKTINYVTKYCLKELDYYNCRLPIIYSSNRPHGIGYSYLNDRTISRLRSHGLESNFLLEFGKFKYPFSRYLKQLIFTDDERHKNLLERIAKNINNGDRLSYCLDGIVYNSSDDYFLHRNIANKNLENAGLQQKRISNSSSFDFTDDEISQYFPDPSSMGN